MNRARKIGCNFMSILDAKKREMDIKDAPKRRELRKKRKKTLRDRKERAEQREEQRWREKVERDAEARRVGREGNLEEEAEGWVETFSAPVLGEEIKDNGGLRRS